jgi:AraC-like DNA-binding protein
MHRLRFIVWFILFSMILPCSNAACHVSARGSESVNPFLQFAGKPYGTYHYALRDTLRKRYYGGTEAFALQTYHQMLQVPDKLHDHQWLLEAGFFRAKFLYRRHHTDSAQFSRQLLSLLADSRKVGNQVFTVRLVRHLFDFHRDLEPISSIPYAMELEEILPTVTPEQFPDVIDCKFRLGEFYLKFNEYRRAERYFLETIHYPYQPAIYQIFIHARNDMGVISRDFYHNLDLSDRWFRTIVSFHRAKHIPYKPKLYVALMNGNLGENQMQRHNYARALPYLKSAIDAMNEGGDYVYCYGMATDIATCLSYLKRYDQMPRYLAKARQWRALIGDSVAVSHARYYMAMSKYFIGVGDSHLAVIYQDSAFNERERMRTHFSPEQVFLIERKMVNMQLQREDEQVAQARREFIISLSVTIVAILFLTIYIVLYVKKRAAYRALVERNISWATEDNAPAETQNLASLLQNLDAAPPQPHVATEESNDVQKNLGNEIPGLVDETQNLVDETQNLDDETQNLASLLERIRHYIQSSQCYLNQEVSLGGIAADMLVNRTYVSKAINAGGMNFNALINEYRVRCAIRILSENRDIAIKELQWQSGFNSRKSFYNAFKNITGMSPTEFKSNMGKK